MKISKSVFLLAVDTPNIINLHLVDATEWLKEPGNIYIGRQKGCISASKWRNPVSIEAVNGKVKAINLYKRHIQRNTELLDSINELKGKKLGCWCAPLPCHGEILHLLVGNRPVYQTIK